MITESVSVVRSRLLQDRCAAIARQCTVASTQTRLEILAELIAGPKDVTSLAKRLELELTWVSNCLRVMRTAEWVSFCKVSRLHQYSLGPAIKTRRIGRAAIITVDSGGGSFRFSVPLDTDTPETRSAPHAPHPLR